RDRRGHVEDPVRRQQSRPHRGRRRGARKGHRREAPGREGRSDRRRAHGRALGHRAARAGLPGGELGGAARGGGAVHPAPPHVVRDVRRGDAVPHREGVARLMADITMPELGETVTEGTITKWFKQVGDKVDRDEPLFEVSTDKVDSEVPSSAGGYLAEILVPEGETVDVGTRLAVVTDQAPGAGDGQTPDATEAEPEAPAPEPEVAEAAPEPAPEAAAPRPEPEPTPEPAPQPEPVEAARPPADGAATRPAGRTEGKVLSPVVRRLIGAHGLGAAKS